MANSGSVVQDVGDSCDAGSTPLVNTLSATGAGNLLVSAITLTVVSGSSAFVDSVTDSGGQTWAQATADNPSGQRTSGEIWYKENSASGITSVTVTPSAPVPTVTRSSVFTSTTTQQDPQLTVTASAVGALLVVAVAIRSSTVTVSSVADSFGNTWVQRLRAVSNSTAALEIWSTNAASPGSVTTVTVHLSAAISVVFRYWEIAGANNTAPIDVSTGQGSTGTGTAANSGTTSAPAHFNDLALGAIANDYGSTARTYASQKFTQGSASAGYPTTTTGDQSAVAGSLGMELNSGVLGITTRAAGQAFSATISTASVWAAGIIMIQPAAATNVAVFNRVYEVSGVPTSGTLDQVHSSHAVSTAISSGATASTGKNEEFVVATMGWSSGTATVSGITSGYTLESLRTQTTPASRNQTGYQFVTATSTFTYDGTQSASNGWYSGVATFKTLASLTPTLSDTLGAPTDSLTKVVGLHVTLTDTLSSLSDTLTKIVHVGVSWLDNVGAPSDSLAKVQGFSRTWTDSVPGLSDTFTKIQSFVRTWSDSLSSWNDSLIRALGLHLAWTDNVAAPSDTLNKLQGFGRTWTDDVSSPSDMLNKIVAVGRAWSDSLSGWSDSLVRGLISLNRAWTDVVPAPSDNLTKISGFRRTLTDSLLSWVDSLVATVSQRFGRAPKVVVNEYAVVKAVTSEGPVVSVRIDEFTL